MRLSVDVSHCGVFMGHDSGYGLVSAKRWAMAVIAACMLSPATGWAQSDALLDDYNQYATFYAQGKYQEALPFALRLVELHKSEFGTDHPTAAVLYTNVADIHA